MEIADCNVGIQGIAADIGQELKSAFFIIGGADAVDKNMDNIVQKMPRVHISQPHSKCRRG